MMRVASESRNHVSVVFRFRNGLFSRGCDIKGRGKAQRGRAQDSGLQDGLALETSDNLRQVLMFLVVATRGCSSQIFSHCPIAVGRKTMWLQ